MLKKRVVAAVVAALMAGSASAVTVNPDGVGDMLVAPAYFIGGGLTTELQVVNTSSTYSTVAKLVFRNRNDSAEILDFLIYLSPNDVWNGKISCAETNPVTNLCTKSVVESSDDSTLMPTGTSFATAEAPFRVEATVASQTTGTSALTNEGYIDIEMGPAFNIAPNQAPKAGVSKAAVLAAYEARRATAVPVSALETPNILTGTVKVNVPAHGTASIPMLALADYDTSIVPAIGEASGFDVLGQRTSLADVEEALWKNNIAVPYSMNASGWSLTTMTFPTKLTYRGNNNGNQYAFPLKTAANPTAPVCYTVDMFDNTEQTVVGGRINISPLPTNQPSCATEMDFKLFGQAGMLTPFSSGWARIRFSAPETVESQILNPADNRNFRAGTPRSGVPVIATYMIKGATGDLTWAYAASSFTQPGTLNGNTNLSAR